jgi:hypothetical protein
VSRPIAKDHDLTNAALAKVAAAQRRGTLSARMGITKHPTQLLLTSTTEKDRAWVLKNYPGGTTQRMHYAGKRGGQPIDRMEHKAPLREPVERPFLHDFVPRVEIWFEAPHECHDFYGQAYKASKPKWRCRSCGKAMPVTKARELGLLPPLTRQRGTR